MNEEKSMIIRIFFVLSLVGCLDNRTPPTPEDCGPLPPAPYWEYTEEGGAPAQAKIPLHLWLQDL